MLSEGWDAKTVTHIMGLRAFTRPVAVRAGGGARAAADLLRGRSGDRAVRAGIRERVWRPVRFSAASRRRRGGSAADAAEDGRGTAARSGAEFEISWPNVVRVDQVYRPRLSLDLACVEPLHLNASQTASLAELAPLVDGEPDVSRLRAIDLERLAQKSRTQRIVFRTAADVYKQMQPDWKGGDAVLLGELVRLVEAFIRSDRIRILPASSSGTSCGGG